MKYTAFYTHRLGILTAILISQMAVAAPGTFRKLQKDESEAIKYYNKLISKKDHLYRVLIMTSKGNMVVKLYDETPLHRDNFMSKVAGGFYDSLLFHRVINQFMIQGGDPQSKYAQAGQALGAGSAIGERIPAEFRIDQGLFHKRGALAAARDNNPEKASSNCQFYIVQRQIWRPAQLDSTIAMRKLELNEAQKKTYLSDGGTPHLDGNYTVFGELEIGFDVLDKIAQTKTLPGDRPESDVRMRMFILKGKKWKGEAYRP